MKQNITQYLMIGLLVAGAYLVGVYKTEVEYLKNGAATGQVAEVAGEKVDVQQPKEKSELTEEEWQAVTANPAMVVGEEKAPVTIVEFTDFQCPFCDRYVTQAYQDIQENYVKTGKVRYMYQDLPLSFHQNAEAAAVAARCAGKDDKYLLMHDKLFSSQSVWGEMKDPTETYVTYAKEMGVSEAGFRACLSDAKVLQDVRDSAALAEKVGATGTPTFYINKTALIGALPFTAFEELIEAKL